MDYNLSYIGRDAKDHQFVVSGRIYRFRRGSSLVVKDNVASVLKEKKDNYGVPLFLVTEVDEEVPYISKDPGIRVPVPKPEAITKITPPSTPKPPLSSKKTFPAARKILDKKKQGKLV